MKTGRAELGTWVAALLSLFLIPSPASALDDTVTIHVTARPLKTFVPAHALGAGVDGAVAGTAARVYRPESIAAMRSMDLRSLTYRLRTELAIEAWHWNPRGTWSGERSQSGYWTSDASAAAGPIDVGWGYRLPRRGSTIDQANDDSYSRIDDGDPQTFWKSNPYLDQRFTGESNALHPQWVVVDLGESRGVDSIRLRWGVPFATRYRVEYGILPPDIPVLSSESAFDPRIVWRAFPQGVVARGAGGDEARRLCRSPLRTRFVRVWMTDSSGNAPEGSKDPRDGLGYALRELSIGRSARGGSGMLDFVRRGRTKDTQSIVYVSSTDPWHRAQDCDRGVEQPGFDKVAASGLANDQPILMPVSILYDTPENAVAELKYLRARGVPVRQIEMGEEADGQYVTPEDYGALYIQWADALHRVDPTVRLGGPSFQTAVDGWVHWADAHGDTSWMRRFLRYLSAHGHRADFTFFSFEWYPFDDIARPASAQVPRNGDLLRESLARLRDEGLPADIPWIVSEYGYSPFSTRDEVTFPGALVNAETVAEFLTQGGDQAFLYGYEPGELNLDRAMKGATWGNLIALLADGEGRVTAKLPAYWTARLLTACWTGDPHRPHDLFGATVARAGSHAADPLVAAYPLRRPDGRWAILLLNKDARRSHTVRMAFDESGKTASLRGPLDIWRYGSEQYAWQEGGANGHPRRSLPPAHETRPAINGQTPEITLPPFSLCVVCGSR